jgi:glutamate carboxypeptidase
MYRWLVGVCALALCASAGATFAAAKGPGPDKKVWDAAQAARADQLKLLETVVNIDSGTGDADGGRKVEAVLIPILQSMGATIETVPAEAPGLPENLVATFTGTGKGRILLIGHIDTVFGPGTVAQRPYRVDGDHARGPGVSDEKGGVIEGVTAMKILHDLGFKDYAKVTFLIETSEERGSPGTQGLIHKLVDQNDVELNLEPGDPPDALTVWRKGSATFHIDVKGRAAHAGIAPQDGRNAIQELIHQIKGLDGYPTSGPGTTLNVDVISGGTRNNIIPDVAQAQINVRVRDQAIFDEVEATMKKDAETHVIPDTTVVVTREAAFPPLANNPGTDALAARAAAIYAPLGRKLENAGNGGASESALASAWGIPALDGLGPVGGGFHSDQEYLDLTTVTPRLYLLTKLVMELGAHPPVHK